MAKLKLLVGRWGHTVLCHVLEQDESLRAVVGDGDGKHPYQGPDFRVVSAGQPELHSEVLYIRGRNEARDSIQCFCNCEDEVQAKQLIAKIKTAVAAINAEPLVADINEHTVHLEVIE